MWLDLFGCPHDVNWAVLIYHGVAKTCSSSTVFPMDLRTVVYISSMEPNSYAVSSDRSEQAHGVASASGTP